MAIAFKMRKRNFILKICLVSSPEKRPVRLVDQVSVPKTEKLNFRPCDMIQQSRKSDLFRPAPDMAQFVNETVKLLNNVKHLQRCLG